MSTSNIPPHAFSNIIAIADETEQAEAQLKREAHRLCLSREHDLLAQLLDRWCDGAPVEVLAWLEQQITSGSSVNG
ncbi:MAG: hypothetical protein AMXMBFR58_11670 [Phycisphaerae bacterium]